MSGFVLDASVALCWCFDSQMNAYAGAVEAALEGGVPAAVPFLWPLEMGHALARAERLRQLSAGEVDSLAEYFRSQLFSVDPGGIELALGSILSLARRTGLSTYDASYLELAIRRGWPLATLDADLRKAARRQGAKLFQG